MLLAALLVANLLLVAYALWRGGDAPGSAASAPAPGPAPVLATAPSVDEPTAVAEPGTGVPAMAVDRPPTPRAPATPPLPPRGGARPPAAAPSRDDLLARGTVVPPVNLSLHVYDPEPGARFVLLDGQRLREGEASRDGLIVERITAEGVVLRQGANRFAVNLQ